MSSVPSMASCIGRAGLLQTQGRALTEHPITHPSALRGSTCSSGYPCSLRSLPIRLLPWRSFSTIFYQQRDSSFPCTCLWRMGSCRLAQVRASACLAWREAEVALYISLLVIAAARASSLADSCPALMQTSHTRTGAGSICIGHLGHKYPVHSCGCLTILDAYHVTLASLGCWDMANSSGLHGSSSTYPCAQADAHLLHVKTFSALVTARVQACFVSSNCAT